jgi:hypothetical protein
VENFKRKRNCRSLTAEAIRDDVVLERGAIQVVASRGQCGYLLYSR